MVAKKAEDPVKQVAIYPRRSLWERIEARAKELDKKAPALALELMQQALDLEEGKEFY